MLSTNAGSLILFFISVINPKIPPIETKRGITKASSSGVSHSETTNNIKEITQKGWDTTQKAVGALKEIYNEAKGSAKNWYENKTRTGGHKF